MKISIEPLQLSVLVAFLREQADDAFPDLKDEQRLNLLSEKWHKYAVFCTCRDDNGRLVGIIIFYANQPEKGEAYIPHVYVDKYYRGKGLFRELLHCIAEYLRGAGFDTIRLEVQSNNERARMAYLKNGFREVRMSDNDSLYMTYKLL